MGSHDDRVVIVTGAGSGIGQATVEHILAEGGAVVAVDREAGGLSGVDRPGLSLVLGDVTDESTNDEAVGTAVERHGGLHGVVLNAGIGSAGGLCDLPMDAFDRVMDVNVRAVVLGMRAAVPHLDGDGAIAVTASISGLAGDPGMWAYNTSKGAAINLVRAAAVELGARGIRVNAVCPGPVRTALAEPLWSSERLHDQMARRAPLGRWAEPEEVAAVLSFLVSPASSIVTGAIVPTDGGYSANNGMFDPPAPSGGSAGS